ncbi:hypothetical protein O1611_g4503 [Lasiodiplodia mahajangana]|uniref:Uncharacterized protein n=1 Tax=Lasiodiplodia mahajangana TaxID=1108764 RepID=A0ACC2JNP8_9PEZI|nr:hypothetical protein O1611_g4503 [Lasiodiplodia mahajangana]
MASARRPIRIANCSGATPDPGDLMLAQAMAGPIDVITGDYLAEANLAQYAEAYAAGKHPGYVVPAYNGLRLSLKAINQKRIKVVINGGGLNPKGLAEATHKMAKEKGYSLKIAYVEGDNLLPVVHDIVKPDGHGRLPHFDSSNSQVKLAKDTDNFLQDPNKKIVAANAYLGCRAIRRGLEQGADIIICGRVADASPVMGAAQWWHGWKEDDFDNFSRRATCKQCKAPRSSENAVEMRLDGQSDECPQQTPSQFVVVRGLAPSANETILAAGVKKLYMSKEDEPKQPSGMPTKLRSTAPIGNTHGLGAKPGSLIRVFMVRDKLSEISCNYGFAEFSTLDDARAAVAKHNAHPQFTISSKPVTVAFIHSGVFIPYLHPVQEQDRKFTFAATHNPTLRLSYWNPSVYASEHLTFDESLYEDKEHKLEHTRQGPDTAAGKESKKRKAEKDLIPPSGKKVIAMAPQLQMWANKHAELHRSKESADAAPSLGDSPPLTGPNAIGSMKNIGTNLPSVSYADLDQICCLLCRRRFKNEPSLRRHEQMSDMHKANLEDGELIAKATQNLKALGKEPTTNYRDRAKERRLAHNQPNKPKLQPPRKTPPTSKATDSTKEAPAKAVISKGAGLLARMGWSTGEGLGVEGGGRTDIIETMAYTPGVGLGAEGGKIGDAAQEAARATKGDYADFVSKAKDKARERYEKMG